jgi:hypothetical protein
MLKMSARWKSRPGGSNWSDFGPDDRRGCLNLIDSTILMDFKNYQAVLL